MTPLNKFLKIFNLTWVIRNQHDLSSKFKCLETRKKKMLIFGYKTKIEKTLFETKYK
jgi:hypothetical protein